MGAERLYTPQMLSAAVGLADYPPIDNACLRGCARASTCGSTLDMDIVLDDDRTIERVGMKVRACAVGQAAAAIFARDAEGRSQSDVQKAHDALEAWLDDENAMPDWPGLDLIAPAHAFPARHGAMLLPWKAALDALSSTGEAR
ncbi:iron-sulfur cluster assembly scaffold protein [Aurantiacibacter gangjinensis]|uniref:Uncharacterized protein n=1 Tax=Aurantiacibacter gangjinensis TaxID=502682 RepID=A0A0G9MQC8_9SPHN|nr:iron-sulfur cluster assembly scaffold protein [Aurantiacibacter gangjinensis]APE28760.1 Putative iron-sulfur cluster assembly scaffold protein for SUF system, SufE2 [Aurantiacibacter gangjinensis]KLE32915.1 hypothetical protein AAW01_02550 [Aurantiacibacter gangjinensis]